MIILEIPELIYFLRKKTHLQEAKLATAQVGQSRNVSSFVHHPETAADKYPTA